MFFQEQLAVSTAMLSKIRRSPVLAAAFAKWATGKPTTEQENSVTNMEAVLVAEIGERRIFDSLAVLTASCSWKNMTDILLKMWNTENWYPGSGTGFTTQTIVLLVLGLAVPIPVMYAVVRLILVSRDNTKVHSLGMVAELDAIADAASLNAQRKKGTRQSPFLCTT
eukprot:1181164-Prorocentrum_minimum.AAC.1